MFYAYFILVQPLLRWWSVFLSDPVVTRPTFFDISLQLLACYGFSILAELPCGTVFGDRYDVFHELCKMFISLFFYGTIDSVGQQVGREAKP